ncbi:MAG TPA: 3-carboxy-cis,cis-muconate cycloisomerase [Pseudonocardiaceae bacterium]|jgi:3-carboxy-cis,cis-muconate cycloisomerase|nr:3-carboxy-cis,cis-muconate cycloisomerase [Pseudonocardiaceae bacterium]
MSEPADRPGLFDGVLAAGPVRDLVSDRAWLAGMLAFEAALAGAQAEVGLIPVEQAGVIAAACRAEDYDLAGLGQAATDVGNPAAPLVRALTAKVAEQDKEASGQVHRGATSQDVVDTAAMLVSKHALAALHEELAGCGELLAALAEEHRHTVQAGRTLLQQAIPVSFGLTAAGWLSTVDAVLARLGQLAGSRLAVQFGGATGTLASLGEHGPAVLAALADRLDLAVPVLPWHTDRTRIAELAGLLGEICGAVGKIATDVTLLAQTEVAEVIEQGPKGSGGSSTMPHKRNPVAAVAALAGARQAPGLVSTLLGAMAHEHQRAAGSWHAEWAPLTELLRATGSAVSWLRTSLSRLRVDPERMRANLAATGGLPLAERVVSALAGKVGRLAAHDAVTECCRRSVAENAGLAELLAADPVVGKHLDRDRIAELLDPAGYLGSSAIFVDRALAWHRDREGAS